MRVSPNPYYLRVWLSREVLEIWIDSLNTPHGRLFYWVKENTADYNTHAPIYYENIELNTNELDNILGLTKSTGILKIPSEDSIANWALGTDGYSIDIEFASATSYSFKTYWAPDIQDCFPESILVNQYIAQLYSKLRLKERLSEFKGWIPFESYRWDGPMTITRYLDRKSRKAIRIRMAKDHTVGIIKN
ncbi:hypothetical protein GC194_06375 [bacterium]|nr:hypothetical protein [bacterium]